MKNKIFMFVIGINILLLACVVYLGVWGIDEQLDATGSFTVTGITEQQAEDFHLQLDDAKSIKMTKSPSIQTDKVKYELFVEGVRVHSKLKFWPIHLEQSPEFSHPKLLAKLNQKLKTFSQNARLLKTVLPYGKKGSEEEK